MMANLLFFTITALGIAVKILLFFIPKKTSFQLWLYVPAFVGMTKNKRLKPFFEQEKLQARPGS